MYQIATIASNSNAVSDDDEPFEISIINDLETVMEVETGYTGQEVNSSTLLLFHIYFLGVISGLIFMSIMWRRIR